MCASGAVVSALSGANEVIGCRCEGTAAGGKLGRRLEAVRQIDSLRLSFRI